MIDYIKFWMAKLLVDVGIFIGVVLAIIVIALLIGVYITIKQKLCTHKEAYTNRGMNMFKGEYHCPDCDLDFDVPEEVK